MCTMSSISAGFRRLIVLVPHLHTNLSVIQLLSHNFDLHEPTYYVPLNKPDPKTSGDRETSMAKGSKTQMNSPTLSKEDDIDEDASPLL